MPNGQFNPLATLATSARQLNEQANQVVKSLGDSFTQTTNQLLASAAQGLPPLPPLPGATQGNGSKNGNGNGNGGNPGNGNGGALPSLRQLVPAQALQAVSQVEDVVIPVGFPRPSQVLLGARPRRQAMEQPPGDQPPALVGRPGMGVGGLNGRTEAKRPGKALGVQAN
jgi:hypothetical protein